MSMNQSISGQNMIYAEKIQNQNKLYSMHIDHSKKNIYRIYLDRIYLIRDDPNLSI